MKRLLSSCRTAAVVAVAGLAASGCVMPAKGTPVFVAGGPSTWWSGKGKLIEVSEDQKRCRVAVRDRALIVRRLWVDCARLHPRTR